MNNAGPGSAARRRSWWGWGWEGMLPVAEAERYAATLLGGAPKAVRPPSPADLDLPRPRISPPRSLDAIFRASARDRAAHTYGKAYRDVVRALHGQIAHPPDLVAYPQTEADVVAVLDWASDAGVAVVPYGGGTSVVGGVECREAAAFAGVVSVDLTGLNRVLEVDVTSRAGRIEAGVLGPDLEDQLRHHGLTLRHFPQSFEFSTLGGWLATRAGGHYATGYTHIDDLVESLRIVTPVGTSESRRLPASGAGPSPDRLFLGSEGALGVITQAWVRLQGRPQWKAATDVRFATFAEGAEAVRALSQSGLFPTNCRLIDPAEAALSGGVTDGSALLVLGFESADHPVDAWLDRAVEICLDHSGGFRDGGASKQPAAGDAVAAWRTAFLHAPYLRDALATMGVLVETFETACTWSAFPSLHAEVTRQVTEALTRLCGRGFVSCRFTHVYPDGPAPYFTVYAPAPAGSEVAVWDDVKAVAAEAILAAGGTITHHHGVGRDHQRWYVRQRPGPFGSALRAAKRALDPAGILNPGVLVPH